MSLRTSHRDFSSEMASHEQNPLPHPHTRHIYFILILRKFTRCETISEAITETRLRLYTCHGHYQFYYSPFLVVSSHLHCGSPKEDLSVDHIWKKQIIGYLFTSQGMFHHVTNSSDTKVDPQYQMPNVQFLSSEI